MKKFLLTALLAGVSFAGWSQIKVGEGQLSGSLESNTIYYRNDSKLGDAPADRFGTNNYMKVDYSNGKLSAGILAEAYMPSLQGYEPALNGFGLTSKYIQWQDDDFSVLVGDIYDQFGSGMIFRSFEDRNLGFNNSLEGIRASYNFNNYVSVKGMYGRPRAYMTHAGSWVRGADMSVSLADIIGWNDGYFTLEGSYVNRFEALDKDEFKDFETLIGTPNLNMYSGRVNFDFKGFSANVEHVRKGYDLAEAGMQETKKGKAWLAELGYNHRGLGIQTAFRRLEYMGTMGSIYGTGTGNLLNYLPALTRQYTYLLTNLDPYIVNTNGEVGGQLDAFYTLKNKNTRSKYWNFHLNFSTYYTLKEQTNDKSELLWRDINFTIERQWGRKLKTTALYSHQEHDSDHDVATKLAVSDIFVADVLYKFSRKTSVRVEGQYLKANEQNINGDFVAGLVEVNLAPKWSFFVSDMYQLEKDKINYYSLGTSYTHSRSRFQVSYGRNRAGYVCSGGVCRYSPAYTGVNFMFTTSF